MMSGRANDQRCGAQVENGVAWGGRRDGRLGGKVGEGGGDGRGMGCPLARRPHAVSGGCRQPACRASRRPSKGQTRQRQDWAGKWVAIDCGTSFPTPAAKIARSIIARRIPRTVHGRYGTSPKNGHTAHPLHDDPPQKPLGEGYDVDEANEF